MGELLQPWHLIVLFFHFSSAVSFAGNFLHSHALSGAH